MAQQPNFIEFRFRGYDWKLRIDDEGQTVWEIKMLFKYTASRFIRRMRPVVMDLVRFYVPGHGALPTDDTPFYPLFQQLASSITVCVEEAICVNLALPTEDGRASTHHGMTVFPSESMDILHLKIFEHCRATDASIWFRVKKGQQTLVRRQRAGGNLEDGDILVVERYDPGGALAEGPSQPPRTFRVKLPCEAVLQCRLFGAQTVADLKWAIMCHDNRYPSNATRLVFRGAMLQDDTALRSHNIGNHCITLYKRNVVA